MPRRMHLERSEERVLRKMVSRSHLLLARVAATSLTLALIIATGADQTKITPYFFPCGPSEPCDAAISYCETIQTDVAALPSYHACKPLPAACRIRPSCDCFPPGTRCGFCAAPMRNAVRVTYRTCIGGI
jgi:hypothetical protein